MPEATICEYCGAVVASAPAESIVVESVTHTFCSERCKLQWGEQVELEEDE
jgi:endogenous inhibitor of DNA gyrase (YacG/DUF329 family)